MSARQVNVNCVMRWVFWVVIGLLYGSAMAASIEDPPKLMAEVYDSGFPEGHDTYNGMSTGSDGKIYYVLCTTGHDVAGRMFCFDPASKKIALIGDLSAMCGEKDMKAVAQGKIHCCFWEYQGRLFFSTHDGYYVILNDMEVIGPPPEGWKPYPGGHFLAYDPASGKTEDFGIAKKGEGIIAMSMDVRRGRLYGLLWPSGDFVTYDVPSKELKNLGSMFRDGENGRGDRYRTICRSIAVNPEDGAVYFSTGDGAIIHYDCNSQSLDMVRGDTMKKDYFGLYDPSNPGHMGYNWRQVVWYAPERSFYGVHGNSGYLFRFDPKAEKIDVLERLTSLPSKRCGMYDQFSYGYLGFTLGPDGRTLYYLTGGPIYENGKRVTGKDTTGKGEAKGLENLHLITYDIPAAQYRDHGAVFMPDGQRPLYVNSIAVGKDGSVYTLGRINRDGHTLTDLICIPAEAIHLDR